MAHVLLLCPEIRAAICFRKIMDYFKEGDDHYRNQKVNEFCDFVKESGVDSQCFFLQLTRKLGESKPQFKDIESENQYKASYYAYANQRMSELKRNTILHGVVITYYEQYVRD